MQKSHSSWEEDVKKYYEKTRSYYRNLSPEKKGELMKKYNERQKQKTEEEKRWGRAYKRLYNKSYYSKQFLKNPERILARRAVRSAKRSGLLVSAPCFCGNEKSEAHHPDYSRPLDVVWLCRKHHRQADKTQRESEMSTGC